MIETAIVGAGPYGLSIAAHFCLGGIPYRILGRPMDSWLAHMPKGMRLKSDGFASSIYDPEGEFTLKRFCADHGIKYADLGIPVRLETFAEYGLAFREHMVRNLEEKLVTFIDRCPEGFLLQLEGGEELRAQRVILAVGITHFEYVPSNLRGLPAEFLSHSFHHADLAQFRGRAVAVLGAGSSAIDLAGLLYDVGADVQLVARSALLKFHERMPTDGSRSLWQRIRSPISGLGPGLRSRFFADAPNLFYQLPERVRSHTVRSSFGPAGGWFAKDKVIGRVPLLLGFSVQRAVVRDNGIQLHLRAEDGAEREIYIEHVIAATGYRVDLNRLCFLSAKIRAQLKVFENTPVLSSEFESSVPGLYFVGLAAANSFGPVMRFAYGAGFTARRLTQAVTKSLLRGGAQITLPGVQM